jgi:hypothetical protein
MNYLEQFILTENGDKKIRRNYEIEDRLYVMLENISEKYHINVSELINISVKHLIDTEDIKLYKKDRSEITVIHTISIKVSNVKGLDYLKEKYGVSIYRLINIAIRNALKELDE